MKPFTATDLVQLERVSDPQVSPDGRSVAYVLRETDFEANRAHYGLWLLPLEPAGAPARRLTGGARDSSPRWSPDGRYLYFLSNRADHKAAGAAESQVWRVAVQGAAHPEPVTAAPLDIASFTPSPDGSRLVVAMTTWPDCDPACTAARLASQATQKRTGQLHERLFVRHWDAWADGRRQQLFSYRLDVRGHAAGEPAWLTRGLDGDAPSKPFGDDAELGWSPDGRTLYFTLRIAGQTEPWSTNFDLWAVPADGSATPTNLTAANPAWDTDPRVSPDGRTLAYLAMKRPGFEADRFGVMLRDLATGAVRELAPGWDRSAHSLHWSPDGRTLYALAEELGQKKLFALDVGTGAVRALTGEGTVSAYALAGSHAIVAWDSLAGPAQLYRVPLAGDGSERVQLTRHNATRMEGLALGAFEPFTFKGWNDDVVHGTVVKPAGYEPGRKYPVALLIHGGPQGSLANTWHYRWNAQTYAAAGFAVVMIDFHGSTGYGQAFTDAISGHWGDRPLEDLQKGWAHVLARYDFIDGERACALGASYGGFMVNWMAGNWSQPWKCLVTHDGILDTRMAYYDTEELWFDEWERGGPQFDNPAAYEQFNPLNHVAKWHVPMLVVHGGRDYRIPDSQGIGVFTALQRRGIPSQFLYFPDENHWVLRAQNSVQWHEVVEAWLRKWTATP